MLAKYVVYLLGYMYIIIMLCIFDVVWFMRRDLFEMALFNAQCMDVYNTWYIVMWMQEGRKWHLGEIEFVVDIESTCKMTHFEPWLKSQLKVFTFLWTKQVVKKQRNTKEIWAQNCFSHKMTKMHLRPSCIQPTICFKATI